MRYITKNRMQLLNLGTVKIYKGTPTVWFGIKIKLSKYP